MFSEILFEPTVFIYSMKYVGFAISDFRGSDFMPAVVERFLFCRVWASPTADSACGEEEQI